MPESMCAHCGKKLGTTFGCRVCFNHLQEKQFGGAELEVCDAYTMGERGSMKIYGIGQVPCSGAIHLSLQTDDGMAKPICGAFSRSIMVVDRAPFQVIKKAPLCHFICYDCFRIVSGSGETCTKKGK
jgi:hypothetical protein